MYKATIKYRLSRCFLDFFLSCYIDLINVSIPGDVLRLSHKSVRAETQLSKICIDTEIRRKLLNKQGSLKKRQTFLQNWTNVAVCKNDIITAMKWKSKVANLVQKLELTEPHNEEWEQKSADI